MLIRSITTSALCMLLIISQNVLAGPEERRQAKRIHDRLTGTPPSNQVLNNMEAALLSDSTGRSAADIAIEDPNFYSVTLKNFASPWTNEEQSVFAPLNDYTATVIGMIRDETDFRQVLYGNIQYTGSDLSNYSNSNNNHYAALESTNLKTSLVERTQTELTGGLPNAATAGVMTTRAAAKAFFYLGTNRAMFRFTLMNHLCTDLEPIRDNSRTPDRVRQDVSRSPGGDSRIYLNSCVSCHAGMDGLAGAFAYYELDFNGDKDTDVDTFNNSAQLVFTDGSVTGKHLINANNFEPGYVTSDDSWINYWRNGPNSLLGWNDDYPLFADDVKGNAVGNGAKSMGMELAHSDAFAQCQVKKAFKTVCLRDSDDYAADRAEVNTIVSDFVGNGYNMKNVFRDVAAYCKGD